MEATDEQITRLSDLALEVSRIKSVPMVLVVSELINTGTLRAMRCSHKGIFTKEQAEAGISILERWKRQAPGAVPLSERALHQEKRSKRK